MKPAWVIAGVPADLRSGGNLRARHLFSELARRTDAGVAPRTELGAIIRARFSRPLASPGPIHLAATQFVSPRLFRLSMLLVTEVLDLHDHPVLHAESLGLPPSPEVRRRLMAQTAQHVAGFRLVVVQSASFADLCEVPPERRLLVPNGTDSGHIKPGPWPEGVPRVGLVSGAAPGRGIEMLVEALRLLRGRTVDKGLAPVLELALTPTGSGSAAYLEDLRRDLAAEPWIRLREVRYPDLPAFFAACSVLVVTHPATAYYDTILPIKVFDSMAAGRPLVVTPRTETVRVISAMEAGLVAEDDSAEALAAAIGRLLAEPAMARRLGANGRQAAERVYDWRILAERTADGILDGVTEASR